MAIPQWDTRGVLPPFDTSAPASPINRSPYRVSLPDLITRFSFSSDRVRILRGLLEHRAELHALGMVDGFQWLDGSFLENIEALENRSPNDIDVVTFYNLPQGITQQSLATKSPLAFQRVRVKTLYHIDILFEQLNAANNIQRLLHRTTYWYSLWSHRRDLTWKGFLEIDLSSHEDNIALATLTSIGGQP